MVTIASLWLPIVLSAVAVFLLSSMVHTVFPWHKGDYPAVPDQDRVMAALHSPLLVVVDEDGSLAGAITASRLLSALVA